MFLINLVKYTIGLPLIAVSIGIGLLILSLDLFIGDKEDFDYCLKRIIVLIKPVKEWK